MEALLRTHLVQINIVLKFATPSDHLCSAGKKVLAASNFLIRLTTISGPYKLSETRSQPSSGRYRQR
jgi:hypothetical protein